MAMIKAQLDPANPRDLYWNTETQTLNERNSKGEFVPVPYPCKECEKFQCTCGTLYRESTSSEIVELIVPMLSFKTTDEVRDIIRAVEARATLLPMFGLRG